MDWLTATSGREPQAGDQGVFGRVTKLTDFTILAYVVYGRVAGRMCRRRICLDGGGRGDAAIGPAHREGCPEISIGALATHTTALRLPRIQHRERLQRLRQRCVSSDSARSNSAWPESGAALPIRPNPTYWELIGPNRALIFLWRALPPSQRLRRTQRWEVRRTGS